MAVAFGAVPGQARPGAARPGDPGSPFTVTSGPYKWAVTSGSLPAGLVLSVAGVISGTPTGTGTSSFTVTATDAAGATASQALSIAVGGASLVILTATLPAAITGQPYSALLAAASGTPPYTWSLTSGSLPAGLSLSPSGTISGTATFPGSSTFTITVTDSASAQASQIFTIAAYQPQPPVLPPTKNWQFIIANPQPDGTYLASVGQAQARTVTFRSDPGQYHEASIDISGYDPTAALIVPLQTDLQVLLNGKVLFCGRFGADSDTADASQWRYAPTAQDYREVLRRRSLAYGGGPEFDNADVADIAWGLLKTGQNNSGQTGIQGYPGGNLGIARGVGQNGLGITRWINYVPQSFAGIEIDNLAQRDPGGFDWDITPYGAADLRLDMWAPNRGTNRGVVLEYGGGLVASWQRTVDPSTYANDIYYTAPSVSASTTVEANSNGGTISNIAHWGAPSAGKLNVADTTSFTPSGILSVHASGQTNAIVNYTGRSGPNFVGCTYVSGSSSGTVSTGNSVTQVPLTSVQLDASDIATRIEGRWSQVTAAPTTITTQDDLNDAAAWALSDAEVVTPSYTIQLYPGAWDGPSHIWIGDTVTVRINAGRLAVNDQLRVTEIDITVDSNNQETATLIVGRVPFRVNQVIPRMLRRLRSLEVE